MMIASGQPPLKLLLILIAMICYYEVARALATGRTFTLGVPVTVRRSERPAMYWSNVIFLALAPLFMSGWFFLGAWVFWLWFGTSLIGFIIAASIDPWRPGRWRPPQGVRPAVDRDVIQLHADDVIQDGVVPRRRMSWQRAKSMAIKLFLYCLIPHVWVGLFLIAVSVWPPLLNGLGHDTNATIVKHDLRLWHGPTIDIDYWYQDGGRWYTDSEGFQPPAVDLQVGSSIPIRSLHWHGHGGSKVLKTASRPSDEDSDVWLPVIAIFWNGIALLILIAWLRSDDSAPPRRAVLPVYRYRYRYR